MVAPREKVELKGGFYFYYLAGKKQMPMDYSGDMDKDARFLNFATTQGREFIISKIAGKLRVFPDCDMPLFQDVRDTLETGDMILLGGTTFIASAIR